MSLYKHHHSSTLPSNLRPIDLSSVTQFAGDQRCFVYPTQKNVTSAGCKSSGHCFFIRACCSQRHKHRENHAKPPEPTVRVKWSTSGAYSIKSSEPCSVVTKRTRQKGGLGPLLQLDPALPSYHVSLVAVQDLLAWLVWMPQALPMLLSQARTPNRSPGLLHVPQKFSISQG